MPAFRLRAAPGRRAAPLLVSALFLAGSAAAEGLRFREVSADWGLAFRHHHGGSGRYWQPETDGSGVVLFDYDLDGDEDVFFIDGGSLPGYEGEEPRSRLFRNDGPGRFVEVTGDACLAVSAYGMGGTAGDVEGDGDLDLYVTAFGANQLFRNRGDGSFADLPLAAGAADPRWSSSAAFADPDRDGDLDLYVVNYLDYELESHVTCRDERLGILGYCHPGILPGAHDAYYRNRGDGSFEDFTAGAGFAANDGKGLGLVFADLDNDAWPDLYVANDTTPNYLFRNRGDGTFEDLSLLSGTAYGDRMLAEAGMGIALGDVDGDGLLDIAVTNYALETNALYRNLGQGLFSDGRYLTGIAEPSIPKLGFGTAFADFDQDGDLDLVVANGHVIDSIERVRPGLTYAQVNQLFLQEENGRFRECGGCGLDLVRVSRGLASGDLDGDGDLDLVITNSNDLAEVYENLGPAAGGWLQVELRLAGANRFGVGARLELESGARKQVAEIVTASSYLSQSSMAAHFGLGAGAPERLTVRRPDGRLLRLERPPANRRLRFFVP